MVHHNNFKRPLEEGEAYELIEEATHGIVTEMHEAEDGSPLCTVEVYPRLGPKFTQQVMGRDMGIVPFKIRDTQTEWVVTLTDAPSVWFQSTVTSTMKTQLFLTGMDITKQNWIHLKLNFENILKI